MGIIKTITGEPSYSLNNDMVSVFISIQGGHLTAAFNHGQRSYEPIYTAPWATTRQ